MSHAHVDQLGSHSRTRSGSRSCEIANTVRGALPARQASPRADLQQPLPDCVAEVHTQDRVPHARMQRSPKELFVSAPRPQPYLVLRHRARSTGAIAYPEILAVAERWRRPMGRAAGANAEAVPKRATARRTAARVAMRLGKRPYKAKTRNTNIFIFGAKFKVETASTSRLSPFPFPLPFLLHGRPHVVAVEERCMLRDSALCMSSAAFSAACHRDCDLLCCVLAVLRKLIAAAVHTRQRGTAPVLQPALRLRMPSIRFRASCVR